MKPVDDSQIKLEIFEELCYLFPVASPCKPGWSHPKTALSCQIETEGCLLQSHSESEASQAQEMLRAGSVRVAQVVPVVPSGRGKGWSWHLQGSPSGKFPGRQSSFRTPVGASVTSAPSLLHGLLWSWNCHVNSHTSFVPEDFPSQPLKS